MNSEFGEVRVKVSGIFGSIAQLIVRIKTRVWDG